MTLTRDQVIQKRGDLSQFLIHLTRTGPVTLRKDIHSSLSQDLIFNRTARERLESLIAKKTIKALSSFGYFHYKVPKAYPDGYIHNSDSKVMRAWLKVVCFTETPLDHLFVHTLPISERNLHFEPYGLAFKEEFIRSQGASPVMYFEADNKHIKNSLQAMAISDDAVKLKNLMPFYESFGTRLYGQGENVDFRWEREWRCTEDVEFKLSDIAFGICKSIDIAYFSNLVGNAFPFIEPPSNLTQLNQVKAYLRSFSHLTSLK